PHLGLARRDKPEHPDRLIFDLDPSDDDFAKVQETARLLRRLLESLELPVFVQTTGSRGLHLVVPLDRSAGFDTVRGFAQALCKHLAKRNPKLTTVEHRKAKRGDRVFLDTLRNAYGQTAVAPYAVRAIEGAPVATPLRWREAAAGDLTPRKYTIKNLFRRLARIEDPWADIGKSAIALGKTRERLAKHG
ncbi:MAG: DNA primase small subunit domain-containing protein, partial [Rhodovibrionaceae bacterium]